ncbi:recombinase family protein [Acidithiobacillus caldus]
MSTKPVKAVLYLRSSKDRSDVSIDAQRRLLMEMAQSRGYVVVGEYADAVESGKDENRPGFQSMIQDIRLEPGKRRWDHVLALDTSRISRRRLLSVIFEEQECKKHGVRVVYKSLPDGDPVTEMLLKSVLQAMDEWHSLTSKVKGLAGMAENVRQGYRAGGPAPKGYRLQSIETGAVRDGSPVTKTKLVPSEEALVVRSYLQHRAKGLTRQRALELSRLDAPVTTLIGIERNALTYAGHTVWNRHAERDGSGYVGESKWKPRSEWVIQRNTHEALISDTEADAILKALEARRRSGGNITKKRIYLLTGLLFSPSGEPWIGDSGYYRLGKGKKVAAQHVESGILQHTLRFFQSGDLAEAIVQHYRSLGKTGRDTASEKTRVVRRIAEIDKKIFRLSDLLSETTAPGALLRQIEVLESERDQLQMSLESVEAEESMARTFRHMSVADVQRALNTLIGSVEESDDIAVKDLLARIVDRIIMDPENFTATVSYKIEAGDKRGEQMALPRGFEPLLPT